MVWGQNEFSLWFYLFRKKLVFSLRALKNNAFEEPPYNDFDNKTKGFIIVRVQEMEVDSTAQNLIIDWFIAL